jgi:NADP-dependent 3-hydroxy acid dehydrogenase YdfG
MNKLKDKVAVVYGNGAVGAAIARAFTDEGAKVF